MRNFSDHYLTNTSSLSLKKREFLLKLFYRNSENACKALQEYNRQAWLTGPLIACGLWRMDFWFYKAGRATLFKQYEDENKGYS